MKRTLIPYRSPDDTLWGVEVVLPSHSGAMVIFHHPTGETARLNRYAWVNVRAAQAQDPREHLDQAAISASLGEREVARIFRRSSPISSDRPSYIVS